MENEDLLICRFSHGLLATTSFCPKANSKIFVEHVAWLDLHA